VVWTSDCWSKRTWTTSARAQAHGGLLALQRVHFHRIVAHTAQARALFDAQQNQDQMELIMSTISQAVVSPQVGTVLQRSAQVLKSWWVTYITWRRERFTVP
jgi:hypothetical protein